jgi:hypothetical protein
LRDAAVDLALAAEAWTVVRVWEHVPIEEAVAAVERVLSQSG